MTEPGKRRSLRARLYHGETAFDFVGRRKLWFAISSIVILAGLVSLVTRGLNMGIDFEGGTAWELQTRQLSVEDARDAVTPVGLEGAKVQVLGSGSNQRIRIQADVANEQKRDQVREALARAAGVQPSDVSVNEVGPSWGQEITDKAQRALVFFLVAITLYITLRFEWKMAAATLAALFHDILVTVGVYSIVGFEVTPATVIAILTILGYSIYDGIVVFDKVEENTRGLASVGRMTYADTVNLSLNQVLMRTLNTSIAALLPILSLLVVGSYILGATTLEEFAIALLIGLGASAYSSIFIASPLLAMLKEREPRYASIRQRLASRGGTGGPPLTPAAAAASGVTTDVTDDDAAPLRPAAATVGGGSGGGARRQPPRPRKKRRR